MDSTFLKWAGGKTWFIRKHADLFPTEYKRYIDPFLGGGAVYFYLEPSKAIVNDINTELITTFKAIQDDWKSVETALKKHAKNHSDEYYYKVRGMAPQRPYTIAARMIYLNRTCFNGIYRVNRQGEFNVPKGSKNTVLLPTDKFEERSMIMKGTKFINEDFEKIINMAKKDDLLFCDPPYAVQDEDNRFVGYTKNLFDWDDQIRLALAIDRARKKGVKIILTNVNHPAVCALYDKNHYILMDDTRFSSLSGQATGRLQYKELIVTANL